MNKNLQVTGRFFTTVWFLMCGLLLGVSIGEIVQVKLHPEEYALLWGAEGPIAGLWYYASETSYIVDNCLMAVWYLMGMLAGSGRWRYRYPWPCLLHCLISLLYLLCLWYVAAE